MDNLVNIEGVEIIALKIINNEDGDTLHILRNDSYMFKKFGECYFSELNSSSIKAWKKHKLQTQNLVVPVGLISIVIYDDRKNSNSYKKLLNVKLGKHENYNLLPGLGRRWSGSACGPSDGVRGSAVGPSGGVRSKERLSLTTSASSGIPKCCCKGSVPPLIS